MIDEILSVFDDKIKQDKKIDKHSKNLNLLFFLLHSFVVKDNLQKKTIILNKSQTKLANLSIRYRKWLMLYIAKKQQDTVVIVRD